MAVLEEKDVMKMLEETEAVLHGHFLLTSGLHSPMYVEKFNVLHVDLLTFIYLQNCIQEIFFILYLSPCLVMPSTD